MQTTKYSSLIKANKDNFLLTGAFLVLVATGLVIISCGIVIHWNVSQQKSIYNETTTCYVRQYSVQNKTCGKGYRCYNEQFKVTYQISNGSQVTSWIHSYKQPVESRNNRVYEHFRFSLIFFFFLFRMTPLTNAGIVQRMLDLFYGNTIGRILALSLLFMAL